MSWRHCGYLSVNQSPMIDKRSVFMKARRAGEGCVRESRANPCQTRDTLTSRQHVTCLLVVRNRKRSLVVDQLGQGSRGPRLGRPRTVRHCNASGHTLRTGPWTPRMLMDIENVRPTRRTVTKANRPRTGDDTCRTR